MIFENAKALPVEMLPGLHRRTRVCKDTMMICRFDLDFGVSIPGHSHPHEQVGRAST